MVAKKIKMDPGLKDELHNHQLQKHQSGNLHSSQHFQNLDMVWNVLWSWLAPERDLGFIVLPKLAGKEKSGSRPPVFLTPLSSPAFPFAGDNMRFSNPQMLIKMWEAVSVRGTPLQIGFRNWLCFSVTQKGQHHFWWHHCRQDAAVKDT